jgi:hypothetical protein
MSVHDEYGVDIKISNDNTKGERRVTIHFRSDGQDYDEIIKKAREMFEETNKA